MKRAKKLVLGAVLFVLAMAFSVTASAASYAPSKVTLTKAQISTSGRLQLGWKQVSNANGYRVKFLDYSKKKVTTKNLAGKTNISYTTTLDKNTVYRVSVSAYRVKNSKKWYSAEVQFLASAARVYGSKNATKSAITVTWNKLKGVNGYRIYRSWSANSGYTYYKALSANTTQYRFTGLTSQRRYIRIIPYKVIDGKKYNLPYNTFSIYQRYV